MALPASVARLEGDYLRTARELEETLAARRAGLAPQTIATIEQSLRTIDEALAEARRALADDPNNQGVLELFTATYEHKLDLLRRAAELYRSARRSGITIRSTVDCLIASVCIRERVPILHADRDFDRLALVSPLVVHPAP